MIYGIRSVDLQIMASLYSPERLANLPQAFSQMIKEGHPHFLKATKELTIWLGDISQESQDFVKSKDAWTLGGATAKCPMDIKVTVAQQITNACPKIVEIQFPDEDLISRYLDNIGTWSPWTFT